jgi:hypothetical protein
MGRDKRPPFTRRRIAAGILLALCVAACGGNSNVQVTSSGSPSTGVSTGGSVNVQGRSTFGALLAIGLLAGASFGSDRGMPPSARAPELDASRRVLEQDCTKPIVDWSANLRCR